MDSRESRKRGLEGMSRDNALENSDANVSRGMGVVALGWCSREGWFVF